MRLSSRHKDVLHCVLHRASLTVAELSRFLPYNQTTIRHCLWDLERNKLIRRSVYVDVYKLGYTPYNMYFSLCSKEQKVVSRVLNDIKKWPGILWMGEIAGGYQYELTFLSKRPADFAAFFDGLSQKHPNLFSDKMVGIEVRHTYFSERYLGSSPLESPVLTFGDTEERIELDELDRKILRVLCVPGDQSGISLSRQLNIPATTFAYRRRKLLEQGVIVGEVYFLERQNFNHSIFNLLLYIKNNTKEFREKLHRFCVNSRNVYCCHQCVGGWDYKMSFEAQTRNDAAQALDDFQSRFDPYIAEMKVFPLLQALKNEFFPFEC